MQRAAREVDKVTQAETRRVSAEKKSADAAVANKKSVDQLTKSYGEYLKRLEQGDADQSNAVTQLKNFGAEFDKLARKTPVGSRAADELLNAARAAKQLSDQIVQAGKARDAEIDAAYRQAEEIEKAYALQSEAAKKANEEEKRAAQNRRAFVLDILDTVYEDERKRNDDVIAIRKSEQEDFERRSQSKLSVQADEAKRMAAFEEAVGKQSARIENQRVKLVRARQDATDKAAEAQRKIDEAEEKRSKARANSARELSNEIHRTIMAYDDLVERIRSGDVETTTGQIQLRQFAQRFRAQERQAVSTFGIGSREATVAAERDVSARQALSDLNPDKIERVAVAAERAETRVSGLTGALHRLFRVDADRSNTVVNTVNAIEEKLANASFTAVHFAGTLRALVVVGAIVFFNELVSGALALAGALTAVASTAVQAGGALAGSLAAGAAQALPVIGLLGAAWGRVGAVFKAVQQNIKAQTRAAQDNTDASERQRNAAERVRNAMERVHDALRSERDATNRVSDAKGKLTEAQTNLNRSIEEGRRQWENILAAERSAQLQSERSVLSQRESREALTSALRSGDVSSTADLSLRIREADEASSASARALERAQADAADARRTGPRGMPVVASARQGVSNARDAVQSAQEQASEAHRNAREARHDLQEARHDARQAVGDVAAADQALQNMLADLSPAERRLYESLNRVVRRYREVFTGPGGVLESIIDAFTFGSDRALELLNDNRLIEAARRLADGISVELRRAFSFLSNESSRSFIVVMADAARHNLPTITELAIQLVKIGEALALAGGPALSRFLDFFTVLATRAAAATGSGSGIQRLTEFFLRGEEYAETITDLALAVGQLFSAIVGAAADEGQGAIETITIKIREATQWINDHQRDVDEFFRDALRATAAIASALVTLARGLFSLFDADQVIAFSRAFTQTFLPAMLIVLQVTGAVTRALLALAGTGPGSAVAQFLIVWGGLYKTLKPLADIFLRLGLNMGKLLGSRSLVGFFGSLLARLGPIGLAITAVSAAFAVLNGKFHIIDKFRNLFVTAQQRSQEAAEKFTDAINRQIEALRRQRDAEERRVASRLSVSRAEIAVERARADARRIGGIDLQTGRVDPGVKVTLERREASLALKQAILDEKQARSDLFQARKAENKADQDAVTQSKKTVDAAHDRVHALKTERSELVERRDEAQRQVDADRSVANDFTKSTEERQRAVIRLRDDEKVLEKAQSDLNENTKDLRHEGDRSVGAWRRYRRAMRDAGKSTDTFGSIVDSTMDGIVSDVNDVLVEFGAKPLRWKATRKRTATESLSGSDEIFGTPSVGGFPGRQTGGFAVPGQGTGDSVYMQAKVEPGEKVFVLNRMASRALDGLQSLNRMFPRFARGGEINWGGHPRNVNSAVKNMLGKLFGRFPALQVTSTTDHSRLTTSGNVSDHTSGAAADVASGDYGYMNRAAEWIKNSGLYRYLKQGIHNPNLAVNAGQLQRPPGQFAGAVWQQHANHIHLAVAGAIGRLVSGAGDVARRTISGPPGRLTDALRGISNRVVRAANSFISRQTADAGGDEAFGGFPSTGAAPKMGQNRLMAVIRRALEWTKHYTASNAHALYTRVMQESGGDPDIVQKVVDVNSRNGDPGIGLGQIIGSTFARWRDKRLPNDRRDPMSNLVAVIRYMFGQYGHVVGANGRGYATGGEIPGALGRAVPILAHAKEWVLNKGQQSKVAGWLGTSIDGLKTALFNRVGQRTGSYAEGGEVQPYSVPADLGTSPRDILGELRRADKVVDRLKSELINSKFTDQLSRSFEAIAGQGGLLDLLATAITDLTSKLDINLKRATYSIDRTGLIIRRLTDEQVAQRTVDNLGAIYTNLRKEQDAIQGQLRDVARRLKSRELSGGERRYLEAVQTNLQKRLTDVRGSIADNLEAQFNGIEQVLSTRTEAANTRADTRTRIIDLQQRARAIGGSTAAALLGLPSPAQIAETRAAVLNMQATDLANVARSAVRAGHQETADTLFAQVAELNQQAIEVVAQGLRDTASEISDRTGRRQARIELSGRAADLRERLGDVAGAFALRGQNLLATGANVRNQIGELSSLLGRAQSSGQTAVAEELIAQIDDLNQQLAENAAAVRENTVSARAAAINAITQRQGFFGGVYSGVTGIINSLGEMAGVQDTGTLRSILQRSGTTLAGTQGGLLQQLAEGFGLDLRGQAPGQLASSLLGLDYDSIERRMIPTERSQFEDLINSLIQNTGAIVDNTKQLDDLNSSARQSFSSSMWTMFRRAIFNGEGGLLPQFASVTPRLDTGGLITRNGLYYGHAGEAVIRSARVERGDLGGDYVDIDLNVTTPTEVLDPVDTGRQLAHAYKNRVKR
jgi:hypothetical protein